MHCDTIPRVVPTLGWKMKSRWDFQRAIHATASVSLVEATLGWRMKSRWDFQKVLYTTASASMLRE
jgi:hypothetical protein